MIGKINKRILAILIVLLMVAVAFTVISTAEDSPQDNGSGDADDPGETMTDIYEKSVVPNALGKPPLPQCGLERGDDDSPGET